MSELAALRFMKGHGTGNDFVVLPDPDDDLELTPELVQALCDRRTGLGADGVLRMVRTDCVRGAAVDDPDARWFMDYRNADGSTAEMCGNGIRVFARYLVEGGYALPGRLRIATRAGVKSVDTSLEGDVTVDMGPAERLDVKCAVSLDAHTYDGIAVSVGNPHLVVTVEDPLTLGPLDALQLDSPHAFPGGVNVEFAARRGLQQFTMRVHERGSGETHSCGTGACAVVAALADSSEPASYTVDLPGGRLVVTRCDNGHLLLRGPAVCVAQGVIREEWLAAALGSA